MLDVWSRFNSVTLFEWNFSVCIYIYIYYRHCVSSLFVSMYIFVCVYTDLWSLCGQLTSAVCCLVFVVRLEYAQALGLSVYRCGLAVGPKAWLRAQG